MAHRWWFNWSSDIRWFWNILLFVLLRWSRLLFIFFVKFFTWRRYFQSTLLFLIRKYIHIIILSSHGTYAHLAVRCSVVFTWTWSFSRYSIRFNPLIISTYMYIDTCIKTKQTWIDIITLSNKYIFTERVYFKVNNMYMYMYSLFKVQQKWRVWTHLVFQPL